ncbi:MAG: hypothetical protein WEC75_14235 [Dehalococcoidia bacterium]
MELGDTVRLEIRPSSFVRGSPFTVTLNGLPASLRKSISHIQVNVAHITPAATTWILGSAGEVSRHARSMSLTVSPTKTLPRSAVLELQDIELRHGPEPSDAVLKLVASRDFKRTFFETRTKRATPRTTEQLRLAASQIEDVRATDFARPLIAPGGQRLGGAQFEIFSFVKRCLITQQFQLPGFDIAPLSVGLASVDEVGLVNTVLARSRWTAQIDESAWMRRSTEENPVVLFRFPRVNATDVDEAIAFAIDVRDRALDLLALYRGARGEPFATAARNTRTDETELRGEFPIYRGNRLGGVLGGESTTAFIAHAEAISSNPLAYLFVTLFRDAQATRSPDFQYFQYFGLLEVIARSRVATNKVVVDFSGSPILGLNGKPMTTDGAQGAVYDLLRGRLQSANFVDDTFSVPQGSQFWDTVMVWSAFRNATAHYGGFRRNSPEQISKWWYPFANQARSYVESQNPPNTPRRLQHDSYLFTLANLTKIMVEAEVSLAATPYRPATR